jgi:chloramphenicol O-acetyltransferase type A
MFKELDIENWPRRSTYEFFRNYDDPFFNITANLDVTCLKSFCRQRGLAFSLASLFYSLQAANSIPEFRIRLAAGKLVEFDTIHATQTILNADETFSFCYFENVPDVFEFDRAGKASLEKYRALRTFDVESDRLDLIYYSVIPWVSFTSFKHAARFDKTQTTPRIVFGKVFDDGKVQKMPVSVEVNHTIVDGFHVGKFFNSFQESIASL